LRIGQSVIHNYNFFFPSAKGKAREKKNRHDDGRRNRWGGGTLTGLALSTVPLDFGKREKKTKTA
jgi:hypothetical protein